MMEGTAVSSLTHTTRAEARWNGAPQRVRVLYAKRGVGG